MRLCQPAPIQQTAKRRLDRDKISHILVNTLDPRVGLGEPRLDSMKNQCEYHEIAGPTANSFVFDTCCHASSKADCEDSETPKIDQSRRRRDSFVGKGRAAPTKQNERRWIHVQMKSNRFEAFFRCHSTHMWQLSAYDIHKIRRRTKSSAG